jgi:hypothetical protein
MAPVPPPTSVQRATQAPGAACAVARTDSPVSTPSFALTAPAIARVLCVSLLAAAAAWGRS